MSQIIRTWGCQNLRCEKVFDSWEPNPSCPICKGVRVGWVPGGGHIMGGATKTGDAELRALVDVFKLGDINSAEAGRAAKKVSLPAPSRPSGPVHTFAGGFSAAVDPTVGAQCVPTANRVDFKVKATPGSQLSPNSGFSKMSVRANTAVEASHKS